MECSRPSNGTVELRALIGAEESTMSHRPRKNRHAFRPTVGDTCLEDRLVLNAASVAAAPVVTVVLTGATRVGQNGTGVGNLSLRQIRLALRQQMAATFNTLHQHVNNQVAAMFANPANLVHGQLTPQARRALAANISGAIDAAALRLSAQSSLLPGAGARLVPMLQNELLSPARRSLSSQVTRLATTARSRAGLQNALVAQLNQSFRTNFARLGNFFNTTPLNRLSVNTTGQRIPLSQFMANQAVNQINNAFGSLANSTINNARTSLFNTAGNLNNQAATAFRQSFLNALGTAAFQTGSILSVFPNAQSTLGQQLQSTLFATGIDRLTNLPAVSFFNNLPGLTATGTTTSPLTFNSFNTGFQNGFASAFQNFTTPLNQFFGVTPTTGNTGAFQLPNGFFQTGAAFPSVFSNIFNNGTFNNGFNNGFTTTGTGFPGFGVAPTGFNTGFGTGFNGFTGSMNQQFGFTMPVVPVGLSPGTGSAGTTGIGTGATGGLGILTGGGLGTPSPGMITPPTVPTGVTPGTGSGVVSGLGTTGGGMIIGSNTGSLGTPTIGSLGTIPGATTASGGTSMVSGLGAFGSNGTTSLDTGIIGGLGTTGGVGTLTGGGFSQGNAGTTGGVGTLTGGGFSQGNAGTASGLGTAAGGSSALGTGTVTGLGAIPGGGTTGTVATGGNTTLGTSTPTGTTFGASTPVV
jgi:hypothetical protein